MREYFNKYIRPLALELDTALFGVKHIPVHYEPSELKARFHVKLTDRSGLVMHKLQFDPEGQYGGTVVEDMHAVSVMDDDDDEYEAYVADQMMMEDYSRV